MLIDTYLCSTDPAALEAFCAPFFNVIGPTQKKPDADKGDGEPALWYAAIRSEDAEAPAPGGLACSAAEAQAVLGVWA